MLQCMKRRQCCLVLAATFSSDDLLCEARRVLLQARSVGAVRQCWRTRT